MPKKKISEDKIEIEVTKSFPLNKIKEVFIQKKGQDEWRNKITLSNEDANYIYYALGDILGHTNAKKYSKGTTDIPGGKVVV